ncbi:BTB/POZ domain-containing protein 9-like [Oppia nitens]|uniref:BTB/POZ domain-containing protein 9-like n=1 Tax=Oppia nitens TaxID=1686743 RepID=UPI0023D9B031|nr:BTB/POZ domain-containing protein 9-like [Oppia nitens]
MSNTEVDNELYPEMDYLMNSAESDVQFLIDGQSVPALKTVLCLKSNVFRAMFSGQWRESVDNTVEIRDTTPEAFKLMIRFIYTEQLILNDDNQDMDHIRDVLKLADKYQLKRLIKSVGQHLMSMISMDRIEVIGRLAIDYQLDELMAKLKIFIEDNISELMAKPQSQLNTINNALNNLLFESFRLYLIKINDFFNTQALYDKDGNYSRYKIGDYTCTYKNCTPGAVKPIDIHKLPKSLVDSNGEYYRYRINGDIYSYSDCNYGEIKDIDISKL